MCSLPRAPRRSEICQVTGGLQDRVKISTKNLNPKDPKAKPTMHESMFWTNASGCLVALVLAFLTGHLIEVRFL